MDEPSKGSSVCGPAEHLTLRGCRRCQILAGVPLLWRPERPAILRFFCDALPRRLRPSEDYSGPYNARPTRTASISRPPLGRQCGPIWTHTCTAAHARLVAASMVSMGGLCTAPLYHVAAGALIRLLAISTDLLMVPQLSEDSDASTDLLESLLATDSPEVGVAQLCRCLDGYCSPIRADLSAHMLPTTVFERRQLGVARGAYARISQVRSCREAVHVPIEDTGHDALAEPAIECKALGTLLHAAFPPFPSTSIASSSASTSRLR